MSGGIESHSLVGGGEDLAEDDLGVDIVGKVQGRDDEFHQVTSVLVVTDDQ